MSPRGRGQPTKLTPERQERIVAAIRAGNYFETSCRLAGVAPGTGYQWMAKGRDGAGENYVEFREAVEKADAEAEEKAAAKIEQAGDRGTWQANAWFLERRFSERWRQRQSNDITVSTAEMETEFRALLERCRTACEQAAETGDGAAAWVALVEDVSEKYRAAEA